jgi:hypothetical protein
MSRLKAHSVGVVTVVAAGVVLACATTSTDGPSLSGDWHGFVALHDEYGVPLASDSGVMVTVFNTGHAGPSGVSRTDGSYDLPGMHTGVYTLAYSGAGLATFVRPEIGFTGGGTQFLGLEDLSTPSTATVTDLVATPSMSGDTVVITGTIGAPPTGLGRYVRLFYSQTSTPSASVTSYVVSAVYRVTKPTFALSITSLDLATVQAAIGSGHTAYLIAYGDSYYSDSYVDTTTGNTIYPNVSSVASNIVSFVMP